MLSKQDETKLQEWAKSQEYLPEFIRDFHDQKDLFKTIHWLCKPEKLSDSDSSFERLQAITWIMGHIYVVDKFLWCMAKFGWTLQHSRKKGLVFRDYFEFNQAREEQEHAQFRAEVSASIKD